MPYRNLDHFDEQIAPCNAEKPPFHTNAIERRTPRVHHLTNIWPSRTKPTRKVILLTFMPPDA
jgi:hypothetical protein